MVLYTLRGIQKHKDSINAKAFTFDQPQPRVVEVFVLVFPRLTPDKADLFRSCERTWQLFAKLITMMVI
jgi:hypothetical protein